MSAVLRSVWGKNLKNLYISVQEYNRKKTLLEFWDEKYGFSFKPFKSLQEQEALVTSVASHEVITDVALVKEFNLEVETKEEVEFDTEFDLAMIKKDTLTVSFSWDLIFEKLCSDLQLKQAVMVLLGCRVQPRCV